MTAVCSGNALGLISAARIPRVGFLVVACPEYLDVQVVRCPGEYRIDRIHAQLNRVGIPGVVSFSEIVSDP